MGAKDTLIDSRINGLEVDQQLLVSQMFEVQAAITWDIAYKAGIVEGQSSEGHQKAILLAIKAARKDGIKEVVEFVEEHLPKTLGNYVGFWRSWQCFLAEKEIG